MLITRPDAEIRKQRRNPSKSPHTTVAPGLMAGGGRMRTVNSRDWETTISSEKVFRWYLFPASLATWADEIPRGLTPNHTTTMRNLRTRCLPNPKRRTLASPRNRLLHPEDATSLLPNRAGTTPMLSRDLCKTTRGPSGLRSLKRTNNFAWLFPKRSGLRAMGEKGCPSPPLMV